MQHTCRICSNHFEVSAEDLIFYDKVSPVFDGKKYNIPPPTLCSTCRSQRRLAFRNERHLYQRKCDQSGETILSIYPPSSPFKVIKQELWWADESDPLSYGKEFDFTRTFTEQFRELSYRVPRLALHVLGNENCDYVNQCGYSKDCYLAFNTDFSEKCYYTCNTLHSKDSLDLFNAEKCELCYESVDLHNCYNVFSSKNCKNSNNLYFCTNVNSSSDCFGCTNLRNKKYCIYNQQLTEQAYKEKIPLLLNGSHQNLKKYQEEADTVRLKQPYRYADIVQCENSSGDYLVNCKNATQCFDSFSNEDIRYCTVTSTCKDTLDFDVGGYECELCLEVVSTGDKNYHCLFAVNHWGNDLNCYYCDIMVKSKNCFGCIGLRNKEYCILNKQYTKEEYEALVPKIIESMQKEWPAMRSPQMVNVDGKTSPSYAKASEGILRSGVEWGEFFPASVSPFGYNETVANEYYPLSKEEALSNGFNWSDYEPPKPEVKKIIPASKLPDNIKDIPDDILNWAIECEVTKKPFRIIKQELDFYREHNLPVPRRHPDQRHKDRMALRNPRKLWERQCDCTNNNHNHDPRRDGHMTVPTDLGQRCPTMFQTTYSPDRKEIVYCEACYLNEVY